MASLMKLRQWAQQISDVVTTPEIVLQGNAPHLPDPSAAYLELGERNASTALCNAVGTVVNTYREMLYAPIFEGPSTIPSDTQQEVLDGIVTTARIAEKIFATSDALQSLSLAIALEEGRTNYSQPPAKGEPEKENKPDPTAFIPAGDCWKGNCESYKQFTKILEEHPEIRTHKPSKYRLTVHAGDWAKYLKHQEEAAFKALEGSAEAVEKLLAGANERRLTLQTKKSQRSNGK